MAKITRYVQNLFGNLVGAAGNYGKFGSLAAGIPQYTKDPKEIQSLDAWNLGWASATVGNKSPALQDRNALDFLAFYQLAYLMQQGVPEWNADTVYYADQFCSSAGSIYKSLTNDNTAAVSDTNNWIEYVASKIPTRTYTKNYFFPTPWVVLDSTAASGAFVAIDLTSIIALAGLNVAGITVQSATVRLDTDIGPGPFANTFSTLELIVWGNTNGNGLRSATRWNSDDSVSSSRDSCAGNVPMFDAINIYYKATNTGNTTGRNSRITVLGFTYLQTE